MKGKSESEVGSTAGVEPGPQVARAAEERAPGAGDERLSRLLTARCHQAQQSACRLEGQGISGPGVGARAGWGPPRGLGS